MVLHVTLAALAALSTSCGDRAVPVATDERLASALREASEAIEASIAAREIPGAILVVGRGDDVLHRAAYGSRAVQPAVEPMTLDTVFDLASLSKVVATATSVMKLVEAGKVSLDAPVARYLPAFGANGKDGITVEQLLLHQGGLIPDNALGDYEDGPALAWERICALGVKSKPGEKVTYTDVGYIVLAELVRAVDGRALDVFAREELFAPLGMTDTTFLPSATTAARAAPTEQRDGRWMRGEVHDPRAHLLGGVAGHAGLFSTADDIGRYCRAILAGGVLDGRRVLAEATVRDMTRPRWLKNRKDARALGFDVDTGFSGPRGARFPRGVSFGHTGFTGTCFWLDPETEAYFVLLTNRVHPDGKGDVGSLRRRVSDALGAYFHPLPEVHTVLTGIDVLAAEDCRRLAGKKVGLITNVTGRTRDGRRTIDVLHKSQNVTLVRLFSPEHGLYAALEGDVGDAKDEATGLPVVSLYGDTRKPTKEMLAGLDALIFDIQDVGVRYYTYVSTLGLAMEACAEHDVEVIVLDRPNPITGTRVAGPRIDADRLSFIGWRPMPVAHGMTVGELALMFQREWGAIACALEVVQLEGWRRDMWWEDTGLPWINPSPNMRNPTQAVLYPCIGLLEGSNLSVGRGTDEPFERFGAPWIDGVLLASTLNTSRAQERSPLAGLAFTPIEFTPTAAKFEKELCRGVQITVVDRDALRPVEAGLALVWHLNRLFGKEFDLAAADTRLISRATWEALIAARDPRELATTWAADEVSFRAQRTPYLLYR
jgi:uncharacterized protein YbbC (DUF1343 family)/CubicO group peptidase (beta-lactamase class C family)